MKRILTIIVLLTAFSATFAQTGIDWTQYGFKVEPGVSVGTPCVLNLMARFWYRNFGISTCGIYLPSGVTFLNGAGGEADVMYKLTSGGRQMIEPYVAVGYGNSLVYSSATGTNIQLWTQYVGLQAGAYYNGVFAQLGVGYGAGSGGFKIGSSPIMKVWPLFQIGYTYAIGSGSSSGSSGGSSGGGSSGGGSSGGGTGGGKK
jgi:uncharacterized membrane protein YgcG